MVMARDSVALATHPKIGERQAKSSSMQRAKFSAQEQAGISLDEQTQQALLQGNISMSRSLVLFF